MLKKIGLYTNNAQVYLTFYNEIRYLKNLFLFSEKNCMMCHFNLFLRYADVFDRFKFKKSITISRVLYNGIKKY